MILNLLLQIGWLLGYALQMFTKSALEGSMLFLSHGVEGSGLTAAVPWPHIAVTR